MKNGRTSLLLLLLFVCFLFLLLFVFIERERERVLLYVCLFVDRPDRRSG